MSKFSHLLGLLFILFLCTGCSKQVFNSSDWIIKHKIIEPAGPGPNYFSTDNVVIGEDNSIKLTISEREGNWYCGEVYLNRPLGYGEYRFSIESPLNILDPQMVLGMFLYCEDKETLEEIDIEILKHVDPDKEGAFTIHNIDKSANHFYHKSFDMSTDGPTNFLIDWRKDSVTFKAENLAGVIDTGKYVNTQNIPPYDSMILRINFYLFQGKAPQTGNGAEILIKEVSFCK